MEERKKQPFSLEKTEKSCKFLLDMDQIKKQKGTAMQKTAVIVLADGFEEIEALTPADVLKRLGCRVILAGLDQQEVTGAHGFRIVCDALMKDTDLSGADAVILPGGLPGATNLRDNGALADILRQRNAAGKLCCAICAAPIVLECAGIINGRAVTGYPGCEGLSGSETLKFTGAPALRTENLVTGKGPGASFDFAREIALALDFPAEQVAQLYAGMMVNA